MLELAQREWRKSSFLGTFFALMLDAQSQQNAGDEFKRKKKENERLIYSTKPEVSMKST